MRVSLVLAVALICFLPSKAHSNNCDLIKDADERHYCRACAGRPGECSFIRDADKRNKCRALCEKRK